MAKVAGQTARAAAAVEAAEDEADWAAILGRVVEVPATGGKAAKES